MTDQVLKLASFGLAAWEEDECEKVLFNPTSLKISLSNQFGKDPPEQHAKATGTKLDVELLFDTTDVGVDVRIWTAKLRVLATAVGGAPPAKKGGKSGSGAAEEDSNFSLPMTAFHWGTTVFVGVIESLTETLDFWSSDGVPLRSSVQLSMKGRAKDALTHQLNMAGAYSAEQVIPDIPDVIPAPLALEGTGATGAAAQGGDANAGRMLAANNGLENMRAPMGGMLGAAAGVQLSAAAGFQMSGGISAGAAVGFGFGASAGASLSAGIGASVGVGMAAGAGIGLGASAGIGFGASAGIGFGASAGAGIGFGASAGAAFGASAGAGIGFGASAGASAAFGASAGAGMSMGAFAGGGTMAGASSSFGTSFGAGASIGGSASIGFGMSGGTSMGMSGGGFGVSTSSTTSITGFDGVTRTETQSTFMSPSGTSSSRFVSTSSGSSSAGVAASQGAFMGLGMSKMTTAVPTFDPDRFLGPPTPVVEPYSHFSSSGRLVSTSGQVAASYTARASVVVF